MRATNGWLKGLNPTVAIVSKSLVGVFVLFGVLMTDEASGLFAYVETSIIASLSWFYIGLVACSLILTLYLMVSRFGAIRLGAEGVKPDFGYFSWVSMLFAAGMGIGLIFWSVAEPITHFQQNPFIDEGGTLEAAQVAMRLSIFHWGLHPWAIYTLTALTFAYFSYRRGLPLTVRSALYPLIGERIWGPIGHAVDILAIFATTFGVATSLGLGATQINTGLNQLLGIDISLTHQLIIIAVITAMAVTSVVSGLERGIRLLSEANLWLSVLLLLGVAAFGPTAHLLDWFLQSVGDYLQNVVWLSFWSDATEDRGWQATWTTFYWGWWISWAPFVGMFIARISRGRTIRELICVTLFVPTLITILWLAIMGGFALDAELQGVQGAGAIVTATNADPTLSLYATIAVLDSGIVGTALAWLATVLIATYFITSSDSGTLVVNTILSVGHLEPPIAHRLIWGISEGAVAAMLLLAGGLQALQAAAISAALPFAVILVLMVAGLLRALHQELPAHVHEKSPQ
jgi:choline/glycine/proline betaine transport protein